MKIKIITTCFLLFGTMALQAQNLKPFKADNNKYGYKDNKGNVTIQPKYDNADYFYDGVARVNIGYKPDGGNGKWGFIDKTGKEVIPFLYKSVNNFKDGKARVRLNGKDFYIDKTGKEVK